MTVTQASPLHETSSVLPDNHRLERWKIAESNLEQSRRALQNTTDELASLTEDLFIVRAEREMYKLRLETDGAVELDKAFLEKAAEYEREIATLKEVVQASTYSITPDDQQADAVIAQASRSLQQDKAQLLMLQSELGTNPSYQSEYDDDDDKEFDQLRSQVLQSISPREQVEAEQKAAEEEITAITSEFLGDDEELDETSPLVIETLTDERQNLQQQLEVDLIDLSRSINEKETLIQQLQQSQKSMQRCVIFMKTSSGKWKTKSRNGRVNVRHS
jgi:hypothetical protein